jgi:WD40 repeat protein
MVYVDMGGKSLPHSYIGFSMRQLSVKLFTGASALLCLMHAVDSTRYQATVLLKSTMPIVAVRFTPSGSVIAVSEDGTATLWDCDIGRPIWNISLSRASRKNDYTRIKVSAMDLSPDGRMAVVAYLRSGVDRSLIDEKAGDPTKQKDRVWETHIVLIDNTNGTIKKDIEEVGDTSITAVVFASGGKYVFVTRATPIARALMKHQSPTSTTHLLNMDTGQVLQSFKSQGWITTATLSPDGRLFAAAAQQYVEGDRTFYELQSYDSDTGKLLHSSDFETTQTAAISFSFDGSILAVSRSGRDGLQVDLVLKDGTQKLTHVVTAARSTESRAVAFVGEHQRLALAGGRLPIVGFDDIGTPRFKDQGGVVVVVDQTTGNKLTSHEFKSFVTSLALNRDGSKMAVGMHDGTIAILTPL